MLEYTAPGSFVLRTLTRHRLLGVVVFISALRDFHCTLRCSLCSPGTGGRGFLGEIHVTRACACAGSGRREEACARPAVNKHCAGAVAQGGGRRFLFCFAFFCIVKRENAKAHPSILRRSTIWLLLLSLFLRHQLRDRGSHNSPTELSALSSFAHSLH